jgi:hypothetical protein
MDAPARAALLIWRAKESAMPRFIVNKNAQANGDHEVHNTTDGCGHMPDTRNRRALGEYRDCHGAVAAARALYPRANGCYHCCRACHSG